MIIWNISKNNNTNTSGLKFNMRQVKFMSAKKVVSDCGCSFSLIQIRIQPTLLDIYHVTHKKPLLHAHI